MREAVFVPDIYAYLGADGGSECYQALAHAGDTGIPYGERS